MLYLNLSSYKIKQWISTADDNYFDNNNHCILFLLKLRVLVWPLLTLTFPSHWTTFGNQRSGLSDSRFVCSQHTAPRNIKISLRAPIYTLIDWSLGDPFCVPREIYVYPGQELNQGPLDLQSNALPLDKRNITVYSLFYH